MKQQIISLFLVFLMLLPLALTACSQEIQEPSSADTGKETANSAPEPELSPTEKLDVNGDGAVKILALGNSFSANAFQYLHPTLTAAGVENLTLGNLVTGACALSTVAEYTKSNGTYENYQKYNSAGERTVTKNQLLSAVLTEEDWDIITLQQVSGQSGLSNSYSPSLETVIDYIKENRTVKDGLLAWHMTWAYQQDSTYNPFSSYGYNQMTMYQAIVKATQEKILTNEDIDLIIPAGTAIQNARTGFFGDNLTDDGYHLNRAGKLIVSYTWAATLLDTALSEEQYIPEEKPELFTEEFIAMAREAASATLEKPLEITELSS